MSKFLLFLGILILGGLVYVYLDYSQLTGTNPAKEVLSPLAKKLAIEPEPEVPASELAQNDIINVLLLGIDRRSKSEAYRTDVMILLSVDKARNRAVLTSIPRDLWYGGGRINAYYLQNGWESMQSAFEDITGLRPDRFILTDFEDFSWVVDAMGGVPVDVEISFTDSSYPVDATFGYQTVSFTQGHELMAGDRALIFARSRKGDFDNGDWGRMRRQHLLLKGTLTALTQPQSFVCDIAESNDSTGCETSIDANVIEKALQIVTIGKMDTNMQLTDLVYLWDFYKDRNLYTVESLLMDYEYVYTPPMDQYGGAWVLAPIGDSYSAFHTAVQNKLTGISEVPVTAENTNVSEN